MTTIERKLTPFELRQQAQAEALREREAEVRKKDNAAKEARAAAVRKATAARLARREPYEDFKKLLLDELGLANGARRAAIRELNFEAAIAAQERYQTLAGLESILENCLRHDMRGKEIR